ncbi:MAG: glycosyltransferase family 4 protein [Desulfobacterales bacterium]|nr:glycosyltransferase family 4 protein [Desulfobacterales bacterium]
MKASAGKPHVLMLAFGHPDNVLSLCRAVSREVCLELVFVVSGDRFRQGIMDIDITGLSYGLNSHAQSMAVVPDEIKGVMAGSFNIRFARTPSRKLIRDSCLKNFRLLRNAAKDLKKEGFDAVHYNGSSGFVGYFRILLKGLRRHIWTIHDYIPHTGEANPKGYFFQKMLMKLGFEYIQHYAWLKERFMAHYGVDAKNVHHVYSGPFDIFREYEPRQVTEHENYILFFGRISPYKGLDSLVDAFLVFRRDNPDMNTRLCIAGSGELWFDKTVLAHPDIFFINRYIETRELVHLIYNCRFVVLPYTDSTHSAVVMTAFAFQKPVVATDVGGLGEVVVDGKTGCLVPKGQCEKLADALLKLTSDDDHIQRLEDNIRQFVETGPINWDAVSKKMKTIYQPVTTS